jgi:hypothetical protein
MDKIAILKDLKVRCMFLAQKDQKNIQKLKEERKRNISTQLMIPIQSAIIEVIQIEEAALDSKTTKRIFIVTYLQERSRL